MSEVTSPRGRRRGHKLVVLVGDRDSTSTKFALRMARAFFHPETDELHLVSSIMMEEHRFAAESRMKDVARETDFSGHTINHIVTKDDESTQFESLARYLSQLSCDLIIMGSTSLCPVSSTKPSPSSARGPRTSDGPGTAAGASSAPLSHGLGSIALKILAELLSARCAPVLVVKVNTRGSFLQSPNTTSLKAMVDLQANSRHVLEWLFEMFESGRDQLMLTVSQAYDAHNQPKPLAQRLLTAFSVQAAVNSFETDKALYRDPPAKALPAAVAEVEPDVLVVQAPRCRGLPAALTELLFSAKTSILIWPADYKPKM